METVGDRLAEAQASGDPSTIRAALKEAQAAGADPTHIAQAMAEIDRMERQEPDGSTAKGEGNEAASDAAAAEARNKAEAFKKQGNERLKENTKKAAREALEFFTNGLEVLCADCVLNAQLYSNRAHVRMLLRQFVEAVDDCRKAIELDAKSLKAYWRAAKASLHLDLCRNGMDFCDAGLQHAPEDGDLLRLRAACAEKLAGQQQRRAEQLAAPTASGDFTAEEAIAVQDRVNDLNEQVDVLKSQLVGKQHAHMKADRTRQVLSETPEDKHLYQSMGRCFLRQDRKAIEADLAATLESLEADVPKLTKAHQELENRRESAQKELQEIVQAIQRRQQRGNV